MKKWALLAMSCVVALSLTACSNPFEKKLTAKEAYVSSLASFQTLPNAEIHGSFTFEAKSTETSLKSTKEAALLLSGSKLSFDARLDQETKTVTISPTFDFIYPNKHTLSTTLVIESEKKTMSIDPKNLGGIVPSTLTSIDLSSKLDTLKTISSLFLYDDISFLNGLDEIAFVEKEVSDEMKDAGVARIITLTLTKEQLSSKFNPSSKPFDIPLFSTPSESTTTLYLNKEKHIIKQDIITKSNGEVSVTLQGTIRLK